MNSTGLSTITLWLAPARSTAWQRGWLFVIRSTVSSLTRSLSAPTHEQHWALDPGKSIPSRFRFSGPPARPCRVEHFRIGFPRQATIVQRLQPPCKVVTQARADRPHVVTSRPLHCLVQTVEPARIALRRGHSRNRGRTGLRSNVHEDQAHDAIWMHGGECHADQSSERKPDKGGCRFAQVVEKAIEVRRIQRRLVAGLCPVAVAVAALVESSDVVRLSCPSAEEVPCSGLSGVAVQADQGRVAGRTPIQVVQIKTISFDEMGLSIRSFQFNASLWLVREESASITNSPCNISAGASSVGTHETIPTLGGGPTFIGPNRVRASSQMTSAEWPAPKKVPHYVPFCSVS